MDSGIALSAHRTINRLSFAFIHAFAWIFVFFFYASYVGLELAFVHTILLYALSQTIICLTVPFVLQHLGHGMKRGMIYATTFAALAFVVLGALLNGYYLQVAPIAIIIFGLSLGLYRGMYRIPYQVESEYNPSSLSFNRRVVLDTIVALMPLLGGFLLSTYTGAFVWMLFGTAAFLFISLVPLFAMDNVYERFSWGYRDTFGNLLSRKYRRLVAANFFAGVEGAVLVIMWPIAIFILVGFSFLRFGAIVSVTFLLTLFVRVMMRRTGFYTRIDKSPFVESVMAASAWILRLTVLAPLGIVLVDVYGRAKDDRHDNFALLYEHTVDGGLYLDEYTALKEEARAIGKIAVILFASILTIFVSLPVVFIVCFIVAAFAAMISIVYSHRSQALFV